MLTLPEDHVLGRPVGVRVLYTNEVMLYGSTEVTIPRRLRIVASIQRRGLRVGWWVSVVITFGA